MEEAYMRESTRKVFSLAEDIFLAAQLRLLFPLGTTLQNNIQKSFIRQKEPAMEKKYSCWSMWREWKKDE